MRYLAAVLILLPLGAGAQSESSETIRGFYAGAGIGSAEPTSWNSSYWYDGNYGTGHSDTSISLFAGYRFNRYLAAEVGWFDAQSLGWDESLVYVPELLDVYNTDVDLDVSAVNATVLGILPFAGIWEGYVRGGVAYYDAEAEQRLTPSYGGETVSRSVNDSAAEILLGFGIGVTFFDQAHLRLEYQSFFIDDNLLASDEDSATVNTLLLDLQYRFGGEWQAAGSL